MRYVVAFGGGVVSFLSPCVLPLVPVHLSPVTGLDVTAVTGTRGPRPREESGREITSALVNE
jgi:cytochrome c biogenesis protein CcdA